MILKHDMPALFSFFTPGLGQLVKGDVYKGIAIFLGWFLSIVIIIGLTGEMVRALAADNLGGAFALLVADICLPFMVWVWNVYDAYNSNESWKVEFV